MIERLHKARTQEESGFTLVELLVVIAILGILAAVVVFAVGGIKDKGQTSACKIDTRTLRTAEEAFFSQQPSPGTYGTIDELYNGGFLAKGSTETLHALVLLPSGGPPYTSYEIHVATSTAPAPPPQCGASGALVDGTSNF